MRHLKTITAAVFTAIAVTNIPVAQASPETDFLDGLNAHGILVYDAGTAVNTGWTLCGAMNNANGAQVAEAFYQVTGWDVPDRDTVDGFGRQMPRAQMVGGFNHPDRGDNRRVVA